MALNQCKNVIWAAPYVMQNVLLYGNTELGLDENKCIFDEVHTFIRLSHRFEQLIFGLAIWYLNYYIVSYILLC